MTFTESNTVEQMILDAVAKRRGAETVGPASGRPRLGRVARRRVQARPLGLRACRPSSRARPAT